MQLTIEPVASLLFSTKTNIYPPTTGTQPPCLCTPLCTASQASDWAPHPCSPCLTHWLSVAWLPNGCPCPRTRRWKITSHTPQPPFARKTWYWVGHWAGKSPHCWRTRQAAAWCVWHPIHGLLPIWIGNTGWHATHSAHLSPNNSAIPLPICTNLRFCARYRTLLRPLGSGSNNFAPTSWNPTPAQPNATCGICNCWHNWTPETACTH